MKCTPANCCSSAKSQRKTERRQKIVIASPPVPLRCCDSVIRRDESISTKKKSEKNKFSSKLEKFYYDPFVNKLTELTNEWKFGSWNSSDIMLSKRPDSVENGSSKPGSFFTMLKSKEEWSMIGCKEKRRRKDTRSQSDRTHSAFVAGFC